MSSGSIDFPPDFLRAAVDVLDEFAGNGEAWGKYTISRTRSLLFGEPREPIAQPDGIKLDNEMMVQFKYLMELGTPWATLKACWELHTDGLVLAACGALRDYLRIAPPTIADPVALAEFMAKETGRTCIEKIPYWFYAVCDKNEPGRINWNPANLPQLIRMMAFSDLPGSPDCEAQCWEPLGGDLSGKIVQLRIDEYLGKLDLGIGGAARRARIEARASSTQDGRDSVQFNRAALKLVLWPTTRGGPMAGKSQEPDRSAAATVQAARKAKRHGESSSKTRKTIREIIEGGYKGMKFAQQLDLRRVQVPSLWRENGGPATFRDAYAIGKPYRQRIQTMKSKAAR